MASWEHWENSQWASLASWAARAVSSHVTGWQYITDAVPGLPALTAHSRAAAGWWCCDIWLQPTASPYPIVDLSRWCLLNYAEGMLQILENNPKLQGCKGFNFIIFNIIGRELKWASLRHETPELQMSPTHVFHVTLWRLSSCSRYSMKTYCILR